MANPARGLPLSDSAGRAGANSERETGRADRRKHVGLPRWSGARICVAELSRGSGRRTDRREPEDLARQRLRGVQRDR